jgi:metal-dependent amidase/aminoacylase/carboxypeptidase family protein
MICNPKLVDKIVRYMEELEIPGMQSREGVVSCASEDFAVLTSQMPGSFMYLSAGFPEEENPAPSHNPAVRFNEGVLPIGAACYAQCATRWLEENQ